MRKFFLYGLFFCLLPLLSSSQKVISMKVDGTINPASADFIRDGIEKAVKENAQCLIIQLNTPGGLLKSTRDIVSSILTSEVPVVVYVSPGGAQSGSAGVFITLAAHIAAMAPGTNIGAAHPVSMQSQMDSIMSEKVTNDAAAFIRSIAEKRNRSMIWAENAVRRSYSYTETEALQDSAIDLIAKNEKDLLSEIDGKEVETESGFKILHTRNAEIEVFKMGFTDKILNLVSDPNIAYILFLLGLIGILFELYNPGAILPGIVGVISLILAFYSMHSLPINYAGLALIIFSIILFLLEIKIVSHGLLAIGGTLSLLMGSLMLIRASSSLELVSISRVVIISATVITALFFVFIIGAGLRAQRNKIAIGAEALTGQLGEALSILNPLGTIKFQGEIWNAESISGKIEEGEEVRITGMKDLKLFVEKTEPGSEQDKT
ncbi:MAG: nodulation protein NfeD [Bacteroidetes bacterium]|nr:nodulation protein NfeD [Bacteroidota bacterium]